MFNIGLPEIGIVLLAVVIAVKPENLPDFLRKMRKVYKMIKDAVTQFRTELHKVEKGIQSELDELDLIDEKKLTKEQVKKGSVKKIPAEIKSDVKSESAIDAESETATTVVKEDSDTTKGIPSETVEQVKESTGVSASNWYD